MVTTITREAEGVRVPTGKTEAVRAIELAPLDRTVGFLLKRAQIAVSRDIHRIFGELDITAVQFSVLTLVANNPGVPQHELAAALDVERPRMVPVLDKLVSRGLAVRRQDEQDKRSRRIHLTAAGEQLLAELHRRYTALEQRLATALGGQERDHLLTSLKFLADLPR
jgi:DNA-binding MarR family transcriptional regulator